MTNAISSTEKQNRYFGAIHGTKAFMKQGDQIGQTIIDGLLHTDDEEVFANSEM